MGGESGGKRRYAGGSEFWFPAKLPAASAAPGRLPAMPELSGLRALIVDDSATNRMILEHHLREWGLECEDAERPEEALRALERASGGGAPFALAVLDFKMPGMSGIELVRAI